MFDLAHADSDADAVTDRDSNAEPDSNGYYLNAASNSDWQRILAGRSRAKTCDRPTRANLTRGGKFVHLQPAQRAISGGGVYVGEALA